MIDSATSPSLRELSEAAPKGPWALSPQEYDDWGVIRAALDHATGFQPVVCGIRGDDDEAEQSAARREKRQPQSVAIRGGFIVALVNAYRNGELCRASDAEHYMRLAEKLGDDRRALEATVAEREARARAEGRAEGQGWQPIETAPKDGTVVDLFNGYRHTDLYWDVEQRPGGGWSKVRDREEHWRDRRGAYAPTAWMLAPAPPALIQEARHEG